MFDYRVSQQVFYSQNSETQLGYDQTESTPEVVSNVFAATSGLLSAFMVHLTELWNLT